MNTGQPACECGCETHPPNPGQQRDSDLHECAIAADLLLQQAAEFVRFLAIDFYASACPTASGGTIGKHLRHLLDHYAAVIAAVRESKLVIDYDHRERDVPMETCTAAALQTITLLRSSLAGLTSDVLDQAIVVRVMVHASGRTVNLRSTVGRELAFATHHALHHHAMMKFIAESFGLSTPQGFGRAPSTLNHESRGPATLLH
jgi:hypothetical protein